MTATPVNPRAPALWLMIAAAGGILLLNMGARQSLGLFIAPLDAARSMNLVGISFAFAVSQFVWGAVQPMYGALVERWGSFRIIALGALLVAAGTALTFYAFAAALGFTWLATVPPTAGLVGKLFGTRYLATLFGLALLSHQVGGFFGAWLGGFAISRFGDYTWMWYADAIFALLAAFAQLPIREARLAPATARA